MPETKLTYILHAGLLGLLALTACEVGPDYNPPATALPKQWVSADSTDIKADAGTIDQDWWKNFNDPVLTKLVTMASAGNPDLHIAEARIEEARAQHSSATAGLWPTGSIKGAADRVALPPDLAFPGFANPLNIYQTQFDASWELDLFGGQKRQVESAEASLQAAEASRADVMVSLMAEVAHSYIDIRRYQAQVKVAEETLSSNRNSADIARQRFNAGDAPRLDLTQAEAQLEQAQSQLPYYRNLLAQAEFSLDVLLGEQPGTAHSLVQTSAPIPVASSQLVMAAPAAVIANRPDIRIAERKLAAATAQQGVAVAKFFPDVSLSGFFGLINTSTSNFLTAGSESWMMGGSVLWPILNYGTLSANLDAANAQQQEALAAYRKTILVALSDVEKALKAYTEQDKYIQSLAHAEKDDRHALEIAQERYRAGLTSFLEVLDAERTLYNAQNQLTDAQALQSSDLVAVYKSLGGGWH